jgi:glucose uptake protein GlcU
LTNALKEWSPKMLDLIGWVANVFFIVGAILISCQKIKGFYCNSIANFIYLIIGMKCYISSLFFISMVLISINIISIINWRKKDRAYVKKQI